MRKSSENNMHKENGLMVPLGYGKYCQADHIVSVEPLDEGRGAGQRTKVFLEQRGTPIIASRSTAAIARAMVHMQTDGDRIQELPELLGAILHAVSAINPLLRSFIRDQGKWDLDR
jgi:hypothetical protein